MAISEREVKIQDRLRYVLTQTDLSAVEGTFDQFPHENGGIMGGHHSPTPRRITPGEMYVDPTQEFSPVVVPDHDVEMTWNDKQSELIKKTEELFSIYARLGYYIRDGTLQKTTTLAERIVGRAIQETKKYPKKPFSFSQMVTEGVIDTVLSFCEVYSHLTRAAYANFTAGRGLTIVIGNTVSLLEDARAGKLTKANEQTYQNSLFVGHQRFARYHSDGNIEIPCTGETTAKTIFMQAKRAAIVLSEEDAITSTPNVDAEWYPLVSPHVLVKKVLQAKMMQNS